VYRPIRRGASRAASGGVSPTASGDIVTISPNGSRVESNGMDGLPDGSFVCGVGESIEQKCRNKTDLTRRAAGFHCDPPRWGIQDATAKRPTDKTT
jgi:hypothetical protein